VTGVQGVLRRARGFVIAGVCVWAWFKVSGTSDEAWLRGVLYVVLAAMGAFGLYRGLWNPRGIDDERETER
jgi:hypothetical protein